MKILEFFGNPTHLIEEYMFDYNKEKREQETRQKAERAKEKEEVMSRRKQTFKSRRFSTTSSSQSSLNERKTHSNLSSSGSSFENGAIVQPPSMRKKMMKESKSEFSLMNKIEKAKAKLPPKRPIETREK